MKKKSEKPILGIDLGNTLIKERKPMRDAYRVVTELSKLYFGPRIHIVSRVDEEQERRARTFVTSEPFIKGTGIPLRRVHFCRERSEKAAICAKFGITHFIDDRPEVMRHLGKGVTKILFDPIAEDHEQFQNSLGGVYTVSSWNEVENLFRNLFTVT